MEPNVGGSLALLSDIQKEDGTDRRFVVIGTPGVGKSRSLNYLIREIILEPPKKKTNAAKNPPAAGRCF